ncbi:extracellular solute-binding protein [Faecalicatena contorta]|uniref:ABC transporter substrate-binding protein n=1 Tax=Faecalicatena contorta TaxID=39482 RepID=UPI00129D4B70|nr:extracellular solute-binding protein [Faecalicatena contorta]MRM88988.1 extracellular solute-binding protein [Faecalicatena contorta]
MKKSIKNWLAGIVVVTMTVSALAGCGNGPAEGDPKSGVASSSESSTVDSHADGEKVKMVIHLNGMDEDLKMQKAMKEIQTMDKYSNIDFEFHGREADFDTTVPVAIAGGAQVDVVILANPMIQQQWADAGSIIPLDDIITKKGFDFEAEFGEYVSNATNNGQIYTIPHNITRWALYYNKDIFDAAGEPYPDSEVPMTWDEYREIAKRITSGTGADKTYGSFYLNWGTFTYGDAIMALGGGDKFYTNDGLSNIEDPVFARSMERVYNMMHVDGSMKTHADVVSSKTAPTDFMNGKYGMNIQGAWVLPWAVDKENYPRDWKIGVAPMPVDSGTQTKTWGIVNGFGITPTSADPELAFDITIDLVRLCAKYADSAEEADRTVEQNELFVDYAEALSDDGITVEQLVNIFTNSDTIFVGEKIMGVNNVNYEKVYMEEVEKYLVKEQDLQTTIDNIKTRADRAIKEE